MNNMPMKLRKDCAADPFYKTCARQEALHDHECQPSPLTGRLIEWEHAFINAGKQVQKKFAIVPLCWYVHSGPKMKKPINEWIALNRATEDEIEEMSRAVNYHRYLVYLNSRFGVYLPGIVWGKGKNNAGTVSGNLATEIAYNQ